MKIKQEQFNKAKKILSKKSFSDIQKHLILSSIYSEGVVSNQAIVSPWSSYFILFRQKAFIVVVAVLLIFGASYASAHSLPGDLLYPIKTEVIEPIGLAFRFSEKAKNEYKISLLKKRVDELEELKQRGKVSESSKVDNFKAINKNIKDLESSAIFNEEGENDYVSEKVRIYNDLTGPELEVETHIEIKTNVNLNTKINVGIEEEGNRLEAVSKETVEDVLDVKDEMNTKTEENISLDINEDLSLNTGNGSEIKIKIPGL